MNHVALIAQDPLARAGLAALLANSPEWSVTEQGPTNADFLDQIAGSGAEILLWDLGWEPEMAVDLLPDLQSLGLPILALSPDPADDAGLLRAGVGGLLARHSPLEQLAAGLTAVRQGLLVADASLADSWPGDERGPAPLTLIEPLTPRENEVLQLLAEGLTNKAIAQRLTISEHTVKFHVNALMAKLDAQSRTDAVVRAARLGLLFL